MHKVNNSSPERKRSHISGLLIVGLELYPWGMSSITYSFHIFSGWKGPCFFPKLSLWLYMKFPPTPTLISPCLSPSTHMSKFFFPLKKWQNETKYTFVIYISIIFHLSTNPLSISASSVSNYFSFHLFSAFTLKWFMDTSLTSIHHGQPTHLQIQRFLFTLHPSPSLQSDSLTTLFSKRWSPCLFLASSSLVLGSFHHFFTDSFTSSIF